MLIAIVPVLAMLLGALVYMLASNPRLSELGKVLFLAAAIALMMHLATVAIRLS